jgi:hypothetical protein
MGISICADDENVHTVGNHTVSFAISSFNLKTAVAHTKPQSTQRKSTNTVSKRLQMLLHDFSDQNIYFL